MTRLTPAQSPDHPNIVVILADDLGFGDVSFNGCPDYQTPNIDSIAHNGILCTNGYVTHPFCSPSRAAILTGRYQHRFGHENQPMVDATNPRLGLPLSETLLPQVLKQAGYVSGVVGKWHLGCAPNFFPTKRGFDEFFGFVEGESTYYNAQLYRNTTPLVEPAYLTDAFTREGVSFINTHATQPFFLYLAYNAVHSPYDQPPQKYLDQVASISDPNRRNYAAMVVALDQGVGQVLQTLQANNLLSSTLVFFLSDNGAPSRTFTRNYPLRGYKLNTLEGGIHVAFAVQWKSHLAANTLYFEPVSSLDIFPTAAAVAGVPLPSNRAYDGINLIPQLAGQQLPGPRPLFWRWAGLGEANGPLGSKDTIWAVRNGPLKLVTERATVGQPPALYNLSKDIGETNDLSASRPQDVTSLKKAFDQWQIITFSARWQDSTGTDFLHDFDPVINLAGDWNGYNKDQITPPWTLPRITAPGKQGTPDALNWFSNTIHVAATGADTTPGTHSFTLIGGHSYSNQWGGATVKANALTSLPLFSGRTLGPLNSISLTDGFYSFRILDPNHQPAKNVQLAVLRTSASPVSVSRSGQSPARPKANQPVVVSITTSQAKSPEERVYVRWSTGFFVTSTMVEASGSGVNYSATIPAQPARTAVQYSILTSAVDLTPFSTAGIIDGLTLATTGRFKYVARQ